MEVNVAADFCSTLQETLDEFLTMMGIVVAPSRYSSTNSNIQSRTIGDQALY